jgi:hypothetical protein
MELCPSPHERETKVTAAGHCRLSFEEIRERVRRLEQTAERKFAEGGIPGMAESKGVNGDLIRADASAGMTQTAIAAKHGLARSTVHHHLRAKPADPPAANGNGARQSPAEDEIAALKAMADAEWSRLPITERLRLLLSRGSA